MNLRIIQWNISYLGKIDKKIDFLAKNIFKEKCIFVLEEVRIEDCEEIKRQIDFNYVYSLDLRKPGKFDGRNRKLGVLIGWSKDIKIIDHGVIERSLLPERTLFAELKLNNSKINILGFHSLTGVSYKRAKSEQFISIAEFLHDRQFNFLCFDANEPKVDSYNISELEFFDRNGDKGKSASLLFGENKVHELEDAFRSFIADKSNKYLSKSPLATSFILTGGVEKRYDYIYYDKDWKVKSLKYLYNEAISAGSDHALVLGDFKKML